MKSLRDARSLVENHATGSGERQRLVRTVLELVLVFAAIPLALLFAYEFIRLMAWVEFM